MTEIKRKHFRFPAYDDHIGVKLKNENRRVLFDGQDDLMTDTSDKPLFEQINEFHFEDYSKMKKSSFDSQCSSCFDTKSESSKT